MLSWSVLLKGVAGGAIIILSALIASRNPFAAGILAVAPVTTLFSFYAALDCGANLANLKEMVVSSIVTLIATFGFLVSVYFLSDKFGARTAIFVGLTIWLVLAFLLYPAIIHLKVWYNVR